MERPRTKATQPLASGLRILLASSIIALGALNSSVASASVEWVMATEYPESNISGVGLSTFARLVAGRTHGAVVVAVAFDNALGVPSGEMIEASSNHRITGGDAFAGPLAKTDAIFGLSSLPFVTQSIEDAKRENVRARPFYESALSKHGMRLLYMTTWPPTGLWSDRPVSTGDDLRTLTVRAYDRSSADVFRSAGAASEFLPFNVAIDKVRRHEINAILSSGDGGAGRKLWRDLPYYSAINYAIPVSLAFIENGAFDALSQSEQAAVLECARQTEVEQYKLIDTRIGENIAVMRANGVTIADPAPPSIMEVLKSASTATVADWKSRVSPEATKLLYGQER